MTMNFAMQAIDQIVNAATEFATNDPEPDPSELWTDILR
jgi:pyruvate dehydrogenase E1 component alpha subunit